MATATPERTYWVWPAQIKSLAKNQGFVRTKKGQHKVARWVLDIAGPFSFFPRDSRVAGSSYGRAEQLSGRCSNLLCVSTAMTCNILGEIRIRCQITQAEKDRLIAEEFKKTTTATPGH